LLLAGIGLCACTGESGGGDTAASDTAGPSDAGADDSQDARVQGTVRLGSGAEGYEGLRVQVCLKTCIAAYTDSNGAYAISGLDPATHAYELWPTPDQPLLVPMVPLTLPVGETNLDARWLAPDQATPIPASPQDIEILPGLVLTIGLDSIEEPFGTTVTDVYAVEVPDSADFLPVEGATPWRMFHLGPFDTQDSSADGFPLRLSLSGDADTVPDTLELWASIQDLDAAEVRWETLGTVERDDKTGLWEGTAVLPHLGTLALVAP